MKFFMVLFHNSSSYSILPEVSWKMSPAARICEQSGGLQAWMDFRSKVAKLGHCQTQTDPRKLIPCCPTTEVLHSLKLHRWIFSTLIKNTYFLGEECIDRTFDLLIHYLISGFWPIRNLAVGAPSLGSSTSSPHVEVSLSKTLNPRCSGWLGQYLAWQHTAIGVWKWVNNRLIEKHFG